MPQVGQPFNPYKVFTGIHLPNALLKYPGLSLSAKVVWGRLAQYAGHDGKCHPKIDTIAEEVALSGRQVKNLLNELVEQGFLFKIKPSGQQRLMHFPDDYVFLWHECLEQKLPVGQEIDFPSGGGIDFPSNTRESLQENKEPPISPKGDDGFDQFWKSYPKKKSKGDAEKAWKGLKPTKDLLSTIITAVERAKVSPDWTKDGGQYIPYPASWLRKKGWEDEEFTPTKAPEPPGEFDHLPRIDYPCWICGCRIDPPETCRLKWHGMTAEQYARGDWERPQGAHHAGQ